MLLSLVYVSRATSLMSRGGLVALRDQASENNLRDQITGLLLYREGRFLQDLEGPEENVLALFARIRVDERNEGVTLVWSQPVVQPRFPRWSMALAEVGGVPFEVPGVAGDPTSSDLPEAAFVSEMLELFDTRS